jgi:hypothetical protein
MIKRKELLATANASIMIFWGLCLIFSIVATCGMQQYTAWQDQYNSVETVETTCSRTDLHFAPSWLLIANAYENETIMASIKVGSVQIDRVLSPTYYNNTPGFGTMVFTYAIRSFEYNASFINGTLIRYGLLTWPDYVVMNYNIVLSNNESVSASSMSVKPFTDDPVFVNNFAIIHALVYVAPIGSIAVIVFVFVARRSDRNDRSLNNQVP